MALSRACSRHGWIVLNGRAPSDTMGAATCRHAGRRTVLDLALVPVAAKSDLRVLWHGDSPQAPTGNYHLPLLATLDLPSPAVAQPRPPIPDESMRLAAVDLTSEQ